MRKISLLIALFIFCSGSFIHAQDFTVNEMMKLRTGSLSNFEDVVMAKGYELNDIDKEYDHYVTFKKGHNTISYGYVKDDYLNEVDTVIIYLTTNENDYNALKTSMPENPSHPNTTHFFKNETHILHVNAGNGLVVHFFTKYNERPLYEVEVLTDDADRYYQ